MSGTQQAAVPLRTCVGCRRVAPPEELVRVARKSDGSLEVGRTRPGRGAWLCAGPACLDRAIRRRALSRALRADLAPGAAEGLRAKDDFADHGCDVVCEDE